MISFCSGTYLATKSINSEMKKKKNKKIIHKHCMQQVLATNCNKNATTKRKIDTNCEHDFYRKYVFLYRKIYHEIGGAVFS